jgi:ribose transport system substrate-binding protein
MRFSKHHLAGLGVALTVALAALSGGCGSDKKSADSGATTSGGKEKVHIAFFTAVQQNTFYAASLEGMKEVAAKMNADVDVFDGAFDPAKQFTQMQDATTSKKFDGYIVAAVNGPQLVPAVEDAVHAGVKVVGLLVALGADLRTTARQVDGMAGTVMNSAWDDGVYAGEFLVKACKGIDPCKVFYIMGDKAYAFDGERLKAVRQTIASAPNKIEIVGVAEGKFLADPSLKVTSDFLRANPDIDVISASGDQMADGAEQAVIDAGREGKIKLLGQAGSKLAVKAIRDGRWYGSTYWMPRTAGEIAAEIAIKSVRGEPVANPEVNMFEKSQIGPFLDKSTAGRVEGEWAG